MARNALLDVDDVSVAFQSPRGQIHAVRNVSFQINPGEIVALVGESGSGKSTTGLATMQLIPSAKVSGSIHLKRKDGTQADLLALNASEIRKIRGNEVAMIFQEPMSSLDPVFTIGTQMCEAARVHQRLSYREAYTASIKALEAVGMPDPEKCMGTFQHRLSGGMRQRVMIAMALASKPSLLIADEPTTALDVTIQAQIVEYLKRIQKQTGMAILFITHNLGLVAEIADRAIVMYAGEIVESGSVTELFTRPRMPYTSGLLNSLPRLGRKKSLGTPIEPIPGSLPSPLALPSGCKFHPRCGQFVSGLCDISVPELVPCEQGHLVRCTRWQDVARAAQ